MELLSYRDQVIWGTSLDMADETEIDLCYKFFKESAEIRRDLFDKCPDAISAVSVVNIVDPKWKCGYPVRDFKLCDKLSSIDKDAFVNLLKELSSADITVDYEKILHLFVEKGYIDIFKCNRVFFVKDIPK